jgi:GTP-binding protein
MHIASAIFHCSAPDLAACPDESLPEFAFIGRSNVGKSSLLNMLAGKQGLARVSTTPGFTKLINIFKMNRTWRLVDLPGYGYAHLARKDRAQFNEAVADYLQHRPNLCRVFALIDSVLPPQPIDLEFIHWLAVNNIPFVLVFTKSDRVKPAKAAENQAAFHAGIAEWCQPLPPTFTCSATTRQGRSELLALIQEVVTEVQKEFPAMINPPLEELEPPPEDLPPIGRGMPIRATHAKRHNPARPW